MKIWIDLTNSPHINFFKPFIKTWEADGHKVFITCRNLANTIELIEQNKWDYAEIGGHAGKNFIRKILYFPIRIFLLYKYLLKLKPDIGISHSSFYSPLVSSLLRIPSIYINDNEYAKGNYLAFKFSTVNYMPEFLKRKSSELNWDKKYNMSFYPGIKEGIYLSKLSLEKKIPKTPDKKYNVYIRPEPWTAEYYNGKKFFFDKLLHKLSKKYNVFLLPRGKDQALHYNNKIFNDINVKNNTIELIDIYNDCDLFIGAGGTMTREIAFLGIPTISIYQDDLLEVDKFLIDNNYMYHFTDLNINDVDNILLSNNHRTTDTLNIKGNKAFDIIKNSITKYGKN